MATAQPAPPDKKAECITLIDIVNKGVRSLETGPGKGTDMDGIASLRAMATAMDSVAADAAALKLATPTLVNYAKAYQSMAKEVAQSAREMTAAAAAKDPDRINAAQAGMELAVKREDPIVDSINKFCQQP